MDTLEDVLHVEDLPKEGPEVVGVCMPVGEHPELMEAARVEVEVRQEAATERADTLRKWAQGLLDAQLERGVTSSLNLSTSSKSIRHLDR